MHRWASRFLPVLMSPATVVLVFWSVLYIWRPFALGFYCDDLILTTRPGPKVDHVCDHGGWSNLKIVSQDR